MLHSSNSLTHYAKGTRSLAYGAPTACRHAVSGSISLLCQRCFSPFPYGTCSLSVICVYLALERWSSQLPAGYHVSHRTQVPTCLLQNFTYGTITLYGSSFQKIWLMTDFLTCRGICNFLRIDPTTPLTQCLQTWHVNGLGSSLFARRYLGNHYYFLFLELLRCISSLRYLYQSYRFRLKYPDITQDAFSHSDIPGSKVVCTSPRLIAANHVLHRLHVPRHPPYALSSFIKESIVSMILPLSFPKLSNNKKILWS